MITSICREVRLEAIWLANLSGADSNICNLGSNRKQDVVISVYFRGRAYLNCPLSIKSQASPQSRWVRQRVSMQIGYWPPQRNSSFCVPVSLPWGITGRHTHTHTHLKKVKIFSIGITMSQILDGNMHDWWLLFFSTNYCWLFPFSLKTFSYQFWLVGGRMMWNKIHRQTTTHKANKQDDINSNV